MKNPIVTVDAFVQSNPLWKVLKVKEGRGTLSYKSNSVLYLVECKNCGDQAEKPGNTISQCRRCKHTVEFNFAKDKFVTAEPTDPKDIRIAKDNLKKPAKKLTALSEDVPSKRSAKKAEPVEEEEEEEEDEEEEEEEPAPKVAPVGLDIKDLISLAVKTSGLKSDNQVAEQKKKKEAYKNLRKEKIEAKIEHDKWVNDDSDHDADRVTPETSILPKKKSTERSKVVDSNVVDAPQCSGVKVEEKTMKVVRLKPGQTFYCKESGILFVVDE